jgi:hypothetical protein
MVTKDIRLYTSQGQWSVYIAYILLSASDPPPLASFFRLLE